MHYEIEMKFKLEKADDLENIFLEIASNIQGGIRQGYLYDEKEESVGKFSISLNRD